jgi:hypothetical protein
MRWAASIGSTEQGLTYRFEPNVSGAGAGVAVASGARFAVVVGDGFAGLLPPPPHPAAAAQMMGMIRNRERLTRHNVVRPPARADAP